MRLQQIRLEVERRVTLAIVPVLFDKMKKFHAKRYDGDCQCDYCHEKRIATRAIANANRLSRDAVHRRYSERLKYRYEDQFNFV